MESFVTRHALTLLLVLSASGMMSIYSVSVNSQPTHHSIVELIPDMAGKVVSTSGHVDGVSFNPKGHVFISIAEDGRKLQVALFYDFVKELNKVEIGTDDFTRGKSVNVTGVLDVYDGRLQIVPRKVGDLKIS